LKRLGVSLDSVVEMRNAAEGRQPDPLHIIPFLEQNGVESIVYTTGTGESQEVLLLHAVVHTHLNLRIPALPDALAVATAAKPGMVTLISRLPQQQTGPVGLLELSDRLHGMVQELRQNNIVTSIRVEPRVDDVKSAVKLGFDYVELDAGRLVRSSSIPEMEMELDTLRNLASAAAQLHVGVAVGGAIDLNTLRLLSRIDHVEEINVGHALFARALYKGLEQAVKDFVSIAHS
jgi:pyridoxine 5-phosphate synthase